MSRGTIGGFFHVINDVHTKRQRQMTVHGWSRQEDDTYVDGELAEAAIPYIQAAQREELGLEDEELQVFWPWADNPPKLDQPRRELLINAIALLVAEVERMDRIEEKANATSQG